MSVWPALVEPAWLALAPVAWLVLFVLSRLNPSPRPEPLLQRAPTWVLPLLVALALADPQLVRRERALTVVLVVDESFSMDDAAREQARQYVREVSELVEAPANLALVSFGADAVIERLPGRTPLDGMLRGMPVRGASDVEGALRLAAGLVPSGAAGRIVLLGDGLETRGALHDAVRAAPPGIEFAWLRLARSPGGEVQLESLRVPDELSAGERFRVRVGVRSEQSGPALVELLRDGVPVARTRVELEGGSSRVFAFDEKARLDGGVHVYRARVAAESDSRPENNVAAAVTRVHGQSSLLMIDEEPAALRAVAGMLRAEGVAVRVVRPSGLPSDLIGLAPYDGLVLSNTAATHFSEEQLAMIKRYVEDLGGGLAMLGGPHSFGPGGYYASPVEEVLPVSMLAHQIEKMPLTALLVLLDKSGSMESETVTGSKMGVAKAAAAAMGEQLGARDMLGVIGFDAAAKWIVPLGPAAAPREFEESVGAVHGGGGTDLYPAMELAHEVMADVSAAVKHVIIVTDGHIAAREHEKLAARMSRAGITISTVAVGPDADFYTLKRIAGKGRGHAYDASDLSRIPRIFTREVFRVARSWVVEEETPVAVSGDPLLAGLGLERAPPLLGYVSASEEPGARLLLHAKSGDPIALAWRYGLGKSLAFTSDAGSRWAGPWLRWRGGGATYTRFLRWILRDAASDRLRVTASPHEGGLDIVAELADEEGRFVNGAHLEAELIRSGAEPWRVDLSQDAPGRYSASARNVEQGPYLVVVRELDEGVPVRVVTASVVAPYPEEFRTLGATPHALEELVERGDVNALTEPREALMPIEHASRSMRSMTPWVLAAAAVLLVALVAARRLGGQKRQRPASAQREAALAAPGAPSGGAMAVPGSTLGRLVSKKRARQERSRRE